MIVKTMVENFYRDTDSHSLINTNTEAYKAYKYQRQGINTVDKLNQEVKTLKNDMAEIKELLMQLVDRDIKNVR